MKYLTYVDSQGVTLLSGVAANIELEYDEDMDRFKVTADCDNWELTYRDFMRERYPNDPVDEDLIADAKADCGKISGWYWTLKEINQQLEAYCNPGEWYEFTWEYDDGTPVE